VLARRIDPDRRTVWPARPQPVRSLRLQLEPRRRLAAARARGGRHGPLHPIDTLSDEQAAHLIRAHEIDILVDLHGLTSGARPQILAYRPATVQMTWLGFPGSTGLPGVDYVIADEFLITPEMEKDFTEKPLRLPDTFQINDRQRLIGPRQPAPRSTCRKTRLSSARSTTTSNSRRSCSRTG
jgi:hypothetical protein